MTLSPNAGALLQELWRAAIQAAQPAACLPGHWPDPPGGRLAVLACGKAAQKMAAAAAAHYGKGIQDGLVIEPAGAGEAAAPIPGFRHIQASHPVPDDRSVAAASAALQLAVGLGPGDLLLVLLSGGGSSLMSLPPAGVTLEDKQRLTRELLACGANIGEINCVRKRLSRIKGGRLAQACRAPVVTLAISDVPGDDPGSIASGPTVPDASPPGEALAVLSRYGVEVSAAIGQALNGAMPEPPGEPHRNAFKIIATGMTALQAAANACRRHATEPIILGADLQGEARDLAEQHARMALHALRSGKTCCLLSGGETTVTLKHEPGRGGRNTEYALALALALGEQPGVWALAADTDGIDGSGGHSGAAVDPLTLERGKRAGLDARDFLQRHDSATYFEAIGGLLTEGPTGTNVNDFRAILVNP